MTGVVIVFSCLRCTQKHWLLLYLEQNTAAVCRIKPNVLLWDLQDDYVSPRPIVFSKYGGDKKKFSCLSKHKSSC